MLTVIGICGFVGSILLVLREYPFYSTPLHKILIYFGLLLGFGKLIIMGG